MSVPATLAETPLLMFWTNMLMGDWVLVETVLPVVEPVLPDVEPLLPGGLEFVVSGAELMNP
jgi:Ni,Fe-hydrogenase III component G